MPISLFCGDAEDTAVGPRSLANVLVAESIRPRSGGAFGASQIEASTRIRRGEAPAGCRWWPVAGASGVHRGPDEREDKEHTLLKELFIVAVCLESRSAQRALGVERSLRWESKGLCSAGVSSEALNHRFVGSLLRVVGVSASWRELIT